jgi:hypothetical protein
MIDVAHILPKLLKARAENPEAAFLAVKLAWSRAAGSGLQQLAIPFRLDGETLVVAVADALWQKQLRSMAGELRFRTNRLLGEQLVMTIDFHVAPAIVRMAGARNAKHVTEKPGPAPSEVLDAAGAIGDEELRARFIRAAENCIARRESKSHR